MRMRPSHGHEMSPRRPRFQGNEECPRYTLRSKGARDRNAAGRKGIGEVVAGSGDGGRLGTGERRGLGDRAHFAERLAQTFPVVALRHNSLGEMRTITRAPTLAGAQNTSVA